MLRPTSHPVRRGEALVDQLIDAAITVGILVLIMVGFITSYRTLLDLAVSAGGYPRWLAPAVPLSFDLGIVVLSLKVARTARQGRTAPVMRLLVAGLSTATVLANASAASTPPAKLLHAVPPAMFVICFESVIIAERRRALAEQDLLPGPLPRLRSAQWVLAPVSSWRLWRARVLAQPTDREAAKQPVSELPFNADHPKLSALAPPLDARPQASQQPAQGREEVVREVLALSPAIAAPLLRVALAERGHVVSLRTAQRLMSSARG